MNVFGFFTVSNDLQMLWETKKNIIQIFNKNQT